MKENEPAKDSVQENAAVYGVDSLHFDMLEDFKHALSRHSVTSPTQLANALVEAFADVTRNAHRDQGHSNAIIRGLAAKEDLKLQEGGSVSAEEARRFLNNISKTALLNKQKKGQLLAWKEGRAFRFPVWQFAPGGGLLTGFEDILTILREDITLDNWGKVLFFLNRRQSLGGRTPLELLKNGELETVEQLARAEAEI